MIVSDFIKKIQGKSYKWYLEGEDAIYDPLDTYYDKIALVKPMSQAQLDGNGVYVQDTSAFSDFELERTYEKAGIKIKHVLEGFTIKGLKKKFTFAADCSYEANNLEVDGKVGKFFEKIIKSEAPGAFKEFKEKIVADLFNHGGLLVGHSDFNNESLECVTGYTKLTSDYGLYDGKPMFNLSGNNRTPKGHSTTYYNAIADALSSTSFDTLYYTMTVLNAKKENGQKFDNTKNIHALVPNSLKTTLCKILDTQKVVGKADNDININARAGKGNELQNTAIPLVNPYLDDNSTPANSAYYLIRPKTGIVMYIDDEPIFEYEKDILHQILYMTMTVYIILYVRNWRMQIGGKIVTA